MESSWYSLCDCAVAAAEKNWYSDDEDETQQSKTAEDSTNDATQNPALSMVQMPCITAM